MNSHRILSKPGLCLKLIKTDKSADQNNVIRALHLAFEFLHTTTKVKQFVNQFNYISSLLYACYKLAQTDYAQKCSGVIICLYFAVNQAGET